MRGSSVRGPKLTTALARSAADTGGEEPEAAPPLPWSRPQREATQYHSVAPSGGHQGHCTVRSEVGAQCSAMFAGWMETQSRHYPCHALQPVEKWKIKPGVPDLRSGSTLDPEQCRWFDASGI